MPAAIDTTIFIVSNSQLNLLKNRIHILRLHRKNDNIAGRCHFPVVIPWFLFRMSVRDILALSSLGSETIIPSLPLALSLYP